MRDRLRRALRHPAGRLTVVFTAVSALAFGLPAALGATWLVGDNLIQNFPLRVLVGVDLRHGHLPLWDPYLWSGSPLLAGFNAGAAYPTTVLFAVLPGALAWVLNQMAVELVAAAGVVALLRVLGRSWLAAGLAAAAFAFGGFMTAQSVHLDLVQAAAWLPWAFVALDRLAHRPAGRSPTPWIALLGAALGLMILSGAVEPIFDGCIVLALYGLWLVWRTPAPRRLSIVIGSAAGLGLGLLLAAAQLLPGAAFQGQSQRAIHSYAYFSSGSMNKSLTILGLDPLLLGGAHNFPLGFVGTFNLPEISSYIGILPVMALLGLLAARHRCAPEAATWWIWYVILIVGLFLTWGGFTPVAHLVYDIPLYNRQRLLNRNLLEVDLALAVIFGIWVDRMFTPLLHRTPTAATAIAAEATANGATANGATANGAPGPGGRGRRWPAGWTSDVVLPLLAPAAVVVLQLMLLVGGPWFPHLLHVPGLVTRHRLAPLVAILTIPSVIALAAGWIVVRRVRLGRRLPALLIALVAVDLLVFNLGVQSTPDPHDASASASATANRLAALLAAQGDGPAGGLHRMAMFDPDRFYAAQANRLGQPDLTILRSLDSVQGYGAVVNERYDAETGTHLQLNLTPSALSGNTLAQLDLGLLVSAPEYFIHLVDNPPGFGRRIANGSVPLPPVAPDPSAPAERAPPQTTPTSDYTFAPPPSPSATLTPAETRTQYFGTVLAVTGVTVPLLPGDSGTLRVGLLSADGGTTTWLGKPRPVNGRTSLTVATAPRSASALVLLASGPAPALLIGQAIVSTAGQGTYRIDGSLRDVLTAPRWRFVGMDGDFCVFAQSAARGRAWVDGDPGSVARVVADTPWGAETIRVQATRPALLIRSVQFSSGWQATVTSGRGPARAAAVQSSGLLQAVAVPAGVDTVAFSYRPSRALLGVGLSAAGVLVTLLLAGWPLLRRRRRRGASVVGHPVPPGL